MSELEKLTFTLNEKMRELEGIRVDNFVYDPTISELCLEIENINKQIKELKEKEGN